MEFRKSDLLWTKSAREHISKHDLSPRQVEEVFNDKNFLVGVSYKNRYKITGKCGKRLLTIIGVKEKKKFVVITARDSDKKERKDYKVNLLK